MNKTVCTLFYLVLVIIQLTGQSQDYSILNYSVEDGLPSNECHRVTQDSTGYIWIATDRGLVRWDGYEFKTYGIDEGLTDISVMEMHLSPSKKVWLSTLSGKLFTYNDESDKLEEYKYNDNIKEYFRFSTRPLKFSVFSDDEILFTSMPGPDNYSIHLYRIDKNGDVNSFNEDSDDFKYNKFLNYKDVIFYKRNSEKEGIESFQLHFGDLTFEPCSPDLKFSPKKGTGFKFGENEFIFTRSSHEYFIQNNKVVNCQLQPDVTSNVIATDQKEIFTTRLYNGGLYYFKDSESFIKNRYTEILSNVSASDVFIDDDNNIWVTTTDKGLFLIKSLDFTYLSEQNTSSVEIINDDIAFISDKKRISYLYDKEVKDQVIANSYEVDNLYHDELNDISFTLGFPSYFSFGQNNWSDIEGVSLNSSLNKLIVFDSTRYIGIDAFLINTLELENNIVTITSLRNSITRLYDIIQYEGDIYIASVNGLLKQDDILNKTNHAPVKNLDFRINCLGKNDDYLFLGTNSHGLILWDGKKVVDSLRVKDGFLSNSIEVLKPLEKNKLLAGTKNGLSLIEIIDGKLVQNKIYTIANGLPSNEVLDVAVKENTIYVATSKGLVSFEEIERSVPLISTLIDQWKVNNINEQKTSYRYNQNNFFISYKSLDFSQKGNINYRYSLDDKKWTNTKNTSLNLVSLSPGSYTFSVQAQNSDGFWGPSTMMPFKINLPWWRSWWFVLLMIVSVGGLLYYYYRSRINKIEQELAIKQEMQKLEMAALRAQMNPHFIFNCLQSIQRFIMANDKDKAMNYLSDFAKLIRSILDASNSTKISLIKEIEMLENYLRLEQLRFNDSFDYSIHISDNIDPIKTMVPPMLVQPFVENSIIHGFNGKHTKGSLFIKYSYKDEKQLIVEVEDNGVGLEAKKVQDGHKSFGTTITKNRLSIINENENNKINYSIPLSGVGTKVELTISLN